MSLEEELIVLSGVVAAQKEYIAALEELIIDWDLLMLTRFPYTWNNGEGLLIQERIRELGIVKKEKVV